MQYCILIHIMRSKREIKESPQDTSQLVTVPSSQGFLLRFMERNYERRFIDEDSFLTFNHFVEALGNEINQDTSVHDLRVFVKMIDTVFVNYNEPFWKKSSYTPILQLF